MFQFQIGAIGSFDLRLSYHFDLQFQFQIGAIGSLRAESCSVSCSCFNSRLVRLVAIVQKQTGFYVVSFNSRLVRLVEKHVDINPSHQKTFQFQIGAIGSPRVITITEPG